MIDERLQSGLDTDTDLDKLIERTEIEGEKDDIANESDLQFSFAKVWAADKDTLEDIDEITQDWSRITRWSLGMRQCKSVATGRPMCAQGIS